jgi:hypothetical protein
VTSLLSIRHLPSSTSPLIGRAAPVGAHMLTDYYGRSRSVHPEIGAVEYAGIN